MNLRKNRTELIMYSIIFVLILIANRYTPLCVDDFGYAFSCENGEDRIRFANLASSALHYSENGRIVACFFIQLFLCMPKIVFDIMNSMMFVVQIWLMRKLCCEGNNKWLVPIVGGIFGLIWCFTPAFGEDYLWLCAAVLYLWGGIWAYAYVFQFKAWLHSNGRMLKRILFASFLGFWCGVWGETTSVVGVFAPIVYWGAKRMLGQKHKYDLLYVAGPFLSSMAGLIFLITRPGERIKIGERTFFKLLTNFEVLVIRYIQAYWSILIIYMVLAVTGIVFWRKQRIKWRMADLMDVTCYLALSIIVSLGMLITTVYPLRVMLLTGGFLFVSIVSFANVLNWKFELRKLKIFRIGAKIALGVLLVEVCIGMKDICGYGIQIKNMRREIETAVLSGEKDIVIESCPDYTSKYICYYEAPYFSSDPKNHVNVYFMKYMNYDVTVRCKNNTIY